MDGLPAQCTKCGLTFLAQNIIGGSANVDMRGNRTNCPRPGCGGMAVIGDGKYQIRDSRVVGVDAPPSTLQMIDRLRGIASRARERVKEGAVEVEELLTEVAEVSPELAKKLRARHGLPIFAIILLLIWLIKSVELNVKVDFNHLIDQAYHLSQGQDPESHLEDPLPIPTKPAPISPPPATSVDRLEGPPNRQARRRQRALARTRPKGPSRL